MLVKWYKSKGDRIVYYIAKVPKIGPFGLGIPMETLGYSMSFDAGYWWKLQKTVLLTTLIEYLTRLLEM